MDRVEKIKMRKQNIRRASLLSIALNVFLAMTKLALAILTSSIAVALDSINNFTDSLSSFVTLIGAYISSKEEDGEHPLGHGRFEYISAMIVSMLVIYAGIVALYESIKKIFHPTRSNFDSHSLIFLCLLILVKIFLYFYLRRKGEENNSLSLIASSEDAKYDALLSLSVVFSIFFMKFKGVNIESFVALIISFFILKSGFSLFMDTVNEILGKGSDENFSKSVISYICMLDKNILGAYDFLTISYGPNKFVGSVYVELERELNAIEIDILARKIRFKVYKKFALTLVSVGIYTKHADDDRIKRVKREIAKIVASYGAVLQNHAFYLSEEKKIIAFDIRISYDIKNRQSIHEEIFKELRLRFQDYAIYMNLDI